MWSSIESVQAIGSREGGGMGDGGLGGSHGQA